MLRHHRAAIKESMSMKKLLAMMVALGLILTAVNILVVDHNRSRWGYQYGDVIEYRSADGQNCTRSTVMAVQPNDILLNVQQFIYGGFNITYADHIDKFTPCLFDVGSWIYSPEAQANITYLGDESVTLPWGKVTCQVMLLDSPRNDLHFKMWMKNGVEIKQNVWGSLVEVPYDWQLTDLSPHLRYAYLGL
jgi:hypothetical protein